MAKRIADKELTDRNWDQEDEAEEVMRICSIVDHDVQWKFYYVFCRSSSQDHRVYNFEGYCKQQVQV